MQSRPETPSEKRCNIKTFAYTARTKSGQKLSGELDAESRPDAVRRLEHMGLIPVSIDLQTSEVATVPSIVGDNPSWIPAACLTAIAIVVLACLAPHCGTSDAQRIHRARVLANAKSYDQCMEHLAKQSDHVLRTSEVTNILFTCWMGKARQLYTAGSYQECRDYVAAQPRVFRDCGDAARLLLACQARQAQQAYDAGEFQRCLTIVEDAEWNARSLPAEFTKIRRDARDALTMPQFEEAKALLSKGDCVGRVGSNYATLNVNPNQGTTLYVDSGIAPQSLGNRGSFKYELTIDRVSIATGTGHLCSSYEDLSK